MRRCASCAAPSAPSALECRLSMTASVSSSCRTRSLRTKSVGVGPLPLTGDCLAPLRQDFEQLDNLPLLDEGMPQGSSGLTWQQSSRLLIRRSSTTR